jgi:hypothetical protein
LWFWFYALYDKVYREDVLAFAYQCCKANGGAAGVGGQSFEDIETYGVERRRDELARELKRRNLSTISGPARLFAQAGRRAATVRDPRHSGPGVETAAVLVLEPIFEADLPPEQYAYRRDRGALNAAREVHELIKRGYSCDPRSLSAGNGIRCSGSCFLTFRG